MGHFIINGTYFVPVMISIFLLKLNNYYKSIYLKAPTPFCQNAFITINFIKMENNTILKYILYSLQHVLF